MILPKLTSLSLILGLGAAVPESSLSITHLGSERYHDRSLHLATTRLDVVTQGREQESLCPRDCWNTSEEGRWVGGVTWLCGNRAGRAGRLRGGGFSC